MPQNIESFLLLIPGSAKIASRRHTSCNKVFALKRFSQLVCIALHWDSLKGLQKKSNHPLCTRLFDGQRDFFSAPLSVCDLDSREREGLLHLKELVPPWICLVSKDFFGEFHTFLSGQVLTFLPNFMKTSSNQRDFI